ncbi:MAG TPA: UbiD family decarboxylase, partial [Dehalococcoidia bacterium]|nr:UbiD family decarboxylase [Dehalococcoidia bacterium]
EVAGILKALDGGSAILFESIKGYPGVRGVGNVFAREEAMAGLFDVEDPRRLKYKAWEALRNPLSPRVVEDAPCQEVVITDGIDIPATLPILKHSERDAGRILGGGVQVVTGRYFRGGSHISFNRAHFRGKDWATIMAGPPTHLGIIAFIEHRDEKVPLTINICPPPAVALAAAGNVHSVVPVGSDELGIAGALQGSPIELVKARTVDAYALAQAEFVIEGYLDLERAWETEEAEALGRGGEAPFFPEWTGYLGRAFRFRKFQVTAVTHRRERPIFYSPLATGLEADNMNRPLREACFLEIADRVMPGLVIDVNIPPGFRGAGGIVFQFRKRGRYDEGLQRNILLAALSTAPSLRLAIAVDEDVDIYSTDDILWAIMTRANPRTNFLEGPRGERGTMMMPMERLEAGGGLGIDATIPLDVKREFERAHYPVDRVDLERWLSREEIERQRALQIDYARVLAARGW